MPLERVVEPSECATLTVDGARLVVRMPTLVELELVYHKNRVQTLRGQKKITTACVVSPEPEAFTALQKARQGLWASVGPAIIKASGYDEDTLTVLEEFEIPDGEMAEAYVKETAKGFAGKIHALSYSRRRVRHALLTRDLRGPEIDEVIGGESTVAGMAALVRRVTLWGDAAAIERDAPGLYLTIIDYLATQAGVAATVEEGEFAG